MQLGLRDAPELNLRTSDTPSARGELCIRSPLQVPGWFKSAASADLLADGGWLLTGDAAQIDADGSLRILARQFRSAAAGNAPAVASTVADSNSTASSVEAKQSSATEQTVAGTVAELGKGVALSELVGPNSAVSLCNALRVFAPRPLFGVRAEGAGEGKADSLSWLTYAQVAEQTFKLALSLRKVLPRAAAGQKERPAVLISGSPSVDWVSCFVTCGSQLVLVCSWWRISRAR